MPSRIGRADDIQVDEQSLVAQRAAALAKDVLDRRSRGGTAHLKRK